VRGIRHDVSGERPHLVIEHVDGPRLSTLIRQTGPLQPQQYLPLAIDAAAALHYFGHVGWVHLDIKPSNVIMGSPARLIDLSVARPVEDARLLETPIGTDAYMAPEQCAPGRVSVPGLPSDVWGLGATLYESVTGQRPFDAGAADSPDLDERYPQLTRSPRPVPRWVPGEVAAVISSALMPTPADRPTPDEIVGALEPVLMRQPKPRIGGLKVHR
jgi:serine/threonine protein kinase